MRTDLPVLELRRALGVLAAANLGASALVFGATDARAQQPAPTPVSDDRYTVVTTDGSQYRGELVERVSGDHVTVKLATGEIRKIPLAEVKTEWRGVPPPAARIPGTPVQVTVIGGAIVGAPLTYHGPDEVAIHLTNASNDGGTLYHESASGWETVCLMPCTTTADPKTSYKLHNSDPFRFPAASGPLDLVADSGARRSTVAWGAGLLLLGTAALVVAPPVLFLVPLQSDGSGNAKPLDSSVGWTTVAVSGAMIVAGIVLLALNPPTTLTTIDGRRIVEAPSIPLPGHLALTTSGLAF
jgi:hypothetical protein